MINDQKTMDIPQPAPEPVHHESKYMTLLPALLIFVAIVCCYIWFSFYRKTTTTTTSAITPVQTLEILREVSTSSELTTKEKEAALSKLISSSKSVEDGIADLNRLNK